jgi:hypothetical protein
MTGHTHPPSARLKSEHHESGEHNNTKDRHMPGD